MDPGNLVVSVVMPCLNEAETLGACIEKAHRGIANLAVPGEVVVADNGSTDGSIELAERLGARVIRVQEKGYGNALRAGLSAAQGKYLIMADSDDSYDFAELKPFVQKLQEGFDLVIGNRFKGGITPGAMPWKHKWIGNPGLTAIGRLLFGTPVGDFISGMRGMTKDVFHKLSFITPGMEFCTELIARCALHHYKVGEVPIILHKDGRSRPPHMRSWRDGWRILRFMLLLSPVWSFYIPGLLLLTASIGVTTWAWGGQPLPAPLPALAGSLGASGYALLWLGAAAKSYLVSEGIHPVGSVTDRLFRVFTLEVGILLSFGLFGGGAVMMLSSSSFFTTETHLALGALTIVMGALTGFGRALVALLRLERKTRNL